ncbi:hypothetical protein ACTWQF_29650 [Streptomyces sp. 8N114]|uniref:hypothetical protein n=1 Tax=Streptomyces sp. 8N114 TaxID=3457419 RepID=UPI003FD20837
MEFTPAPGTVPGCGSRRPSCLPIGGRGLTDTVSTLHAAWRSAGRPGTPAVVPGFVLPSPGKLQHYRDLGAEEVLLQLPPGTELAVLSTLNDYTQHL